MPCNNYVSIPVDQKNILLTWSSDSEMYVSSTSVMDLASCLSSDNLECRQGIVYCDGPSLVRPGRYGSQVTF